MSTGYEFPVYMSKYARVTRIKVTKTTEGWTFDLFGAIGTDQDGLVDGDPESGLYDLLIREEMSYPADLCDYFGWVWKHVPDGAETQAALKEIAEWVSLCERHAPKGGLFDGLR